MTTQTPPIILGQRLRSEADEAVTSDLQQVVSRVLGVLSRRRWLFVFPLLTGILVTLAVGLLTPREYYLSATFERRDDVVISKLIDNNSPYSFATLRDSLQSDLKSYGTIAAAVEHLGLTRDLPRDDDGRLTAEGRARKQELVGRLSGSISVGVKQQSDFLDIVEVTYLGVEPEIGGPVINQLEDDYMASARVKVAEVLESAYSFFSKEAQKAQAAVVRIEDELLRELVEHPGVNPSSPDLIDQRILAQGLTLESLERERARLETGIRTRVACLEDLDQRTQANQERQSEPLPATPSASTTANPRRALLAQQIEKLRAEIADMKAIRQMKDEHPEIAKLRRKLEDVEAQLELEPAMIPVNSPVLPNVATAPDSSSVESERRRLEIELESLRDSLASIDESETKAKARMAQLEKEKSNLFERRQHYMLRQQDLQDAKAAFTLWKGHMDKIGRIMTAKAEDRGIELSIISRAGDPGKPVSPSTAGMFMLSGGIGVALAVLCVFFREVLDRSLRHPSRIRQTLGIPVLETIGEIRIGVRKGWLTRQRVLAGLAGVEAVLVLTLGCLTYLSIERSRLYDELVAKAVTLWSG